MDKLSADIRYAFRGFRHAPVFTLTAVLTLALGIGGTTAIFSLMHAVMMRSLPVANPESLYRIGDGNDCCIEGGPQDRWGLYSFPLFEKLKASMPEFEQVTAFQGGRQTFSVRREQEKVASPVPSEFVTGNYFETFGIRPFAGRLLSEADDRPSATPVAVLSYRAWQGRYGGDSSVIGSMLIVEGRAFSVTGIAPPGFFGETLRGDPPELWIPLQQEPLINGSNSLLHQPITASLRVIGRLRSGASVDGVAPRLTAVLRQWMQYESGYPPSFMGEIAKTLPKQTIAVVPAGSGVAEMKEDYGRSLQILMAVCGLVLLIACANLANLLLARGMARRTQTSVRIAIGASRGSIVRQALTESALLGLLGGIAGLLVAEGAQTVLLKIAFRWARFVPIETTPSLAVLGFTFGLSLLTGILFGTAPAWLATRTNPVEAMRGAGRSTVDRSGLPRRLLLVFQATISVVLIAGATMLARSLNNLENQHLGLEMKNRVLVSVNAPPSTYTPEQLDALYRNLENKLAGLPGVERTGLALYNPLTDNFGEMIMIEGRENVNLDMNATASWDRVTPGFFATVGQRILRGRGFTDADRSHTTAVAVVNESFARRFFPKEDPLDKRFGLDVPEASRTFRIVGVVSDAKYTQPSQDTRPMFFVPLAQYVTYAHPLMQKLELRSHYIGGAMLVTAADPGALEPVLRKTFADVDPNLTVNNVRTMRQQVAINFDQQRAVASLAGLFGTVALVLAAVGLYGLTAYAVVQRTSEIGVRMALGADRTNIVRLVLRGAFKNVALGLVLGIPLAIGAGRLISAQLYGVTSWDPWSLSAAVIALGFFAFLATSIPAARASAIDPMRALRTE